MPRRVFFATSFVACGMLFFEILQTVTLSMQLFAQNAFLVVSIAMLGLGCGGSAVTFLVKNQRLPSPLRLLWGSALGFSLSLLAVNGIVSRFGQIELLIFLSAFPYIFIGLFLSTLFSSFPEQIDRSYFFDLIGSAFGCLGVVLLLGWTQSAPRVLLFAALLGAFAVFLLGTLFSKKHAWIGVGLGGVFLLLLPWAEELFPFHPSPEKHYGWLLHTKGVETKRLHSEWGYLGRLDIVEPIRGLEKIEYGGLAQTHLDQGGDFRFLFASGDNWSYSLKFKEKKQMEAFLRRAAAASPYYLLPPRPEVLVIGVGGGADIFFAVKHDAAFVDAVEINPQMLRASRGLGKDWWDGTLQDLRVAYHVMDGRTFAQTTTKSYDLITLTAVDTGAGLAKGGLMLSENYLYTEEAFTRYFSLLRPGGCIFVYRPPLHLKRTALVAARVLEKRGVRSFDKHVLFLGSGSWQGMMLFRDPLSEASYPRLKSALDAGLAEKTLHFFPGHTGVSTEYKALVHAFQRGDLEALLANTPGLRPITDDWPFFYFFSASFWNSEAGHLIGRLLLWILFLGFVLILLPLRGLPLSPKKRETFTTFFYFAGIGLGFMFAEIAILQKLVLYLGHPTYSVSVTLFLLLLSTGVGSYLSGRSQTPPAAQLHRCLLLLVAFLGLLAWLLPSLLEKTIVPSFIFRLLLLAVLLFPLGFLFGMAFPLKTRLLADSNPAFIPWAWAINAIASVAGSACAMILAMNYGFQSLLGVAAALYLLTWFAHLAAPRSSPSSRLSS